MKTAAIEIQDLVHRFGQTEALHGLSLRVEPGECYGFFGRNGAGKTTTIKCLLRLLKPRSGTVRVFGLDPGTDEAAVKARLAYVPDFVAFYPWMRVSDALAYQASFRQRWNRGLQEDLMRQFGLELKAPVSGLSKGQRTQLALIGAIAAEPDMLVLDEPTSGLDPLVRREFIRTVIGTYQDAMPGRTVFVSTHLITEFEGLIDRFTVLESGRALLTADADEARSKFRRLRAVFERDVPELKQLGGARSVRIQGRTVELIVNGDAGIQRERLAGLSPSRIEEESLSLEEIFLASLQHNTP